jgi:putative endonuclease
MPSSDPKGRDAESRAADYLLELGYCIVTRNFRVRGGEIDLICMDGEVVVFVEVKGRSAPGYRPEDAIDQAKLTHLQTAARKYLAQMEERRPHRFDVIAIDGDGLRHHKHIFNH